MTKLIILLLVLTVTVEVVSQSPQPDLTKKEDLKALGVGRIVEKDRSIVKNIMLHEVNEYWIVYLKNQSVHDMMMESIDRLEFLESKWGRLTIKFQDGKPKIFKMAY